MNEGKTGRTKTRRRTFSLQFLTLCVTFSALLFAWFAWNQNTNRRRVAALKELESRDVYVSYTELAWNAEGTRLPLPSSENVTANDAIFAKVCSMLGEQTPFLVDSICVNERQTVPEEIVSLASVFDELRELNFAGNELSRHSLDTISTFRHLNSLELWCNKLPHIENSLSKLKSLRSLNLIGVEIDDDLVREVGKLGSLSYLTLDSENVTTGPDSLEHLRQLSSLANLSFKGDAIRLIDEAPPLPQVRHLKIVQHFSERRTRDLGFLKKFRNLESFSLHFDSLGSNAFSNLQFCPNLMSLDLAYSDADDRIADSICKLRYLHNLELKGTKVTDVAMKSIGNIPSLRILNLSDCVITDDGLRSLWDLHELEILELDGTQVSAEARQEFFQSHRECRDGFPTGCFSY